MKPIVFVMMPINKTYEVVYTKVINPVLERLGFDIIRADKINQSTFIFADIENFIKQADLVVIEATDQNPNVYYESGIANTLRKEMIILTQKVEELPFDTKHLRHLLYNVRDLPKLEQEFNNWVKNTRAFSLHLEKKIVAKLIRGEIFKDIFDSTANIVTTNQSVERQIQKEIQSGGMISCFQSYKTENGTLHWLKLSSDPLYKVFIESINFLDSHSSEIFQTMGDKFIKTNPDYISLGPGNGQKDCVLLSSLLSKINIQSEIFYYPVDVSHRMLSNAIQTIISDEHIRGKIKIKAVHSEFDKLSDFRPVFDYRSEPNLFVFLGNTLGNIQNELTFLQTIKSVMRTGDMFLLEVRCQTTSLELGGNEEDQLGLSFSPLERLGISYDRTNIYQVEEDSFSQIKNTRTLVTNYKEAVINDIQYENIILSCVNFYNPDSLEEVLCGHLLNFKLLKQFKTQSLVYYVLTKQ